MPRDALPGPSSSDSERRSRRSARRGPGRDGSGRDGSGRHRDGSGRVRAALTPLTPRWRGGRGARGGPVGRGAATCGPARSHGARGRPVRP